MPSLKNLQCTVRWSRTRKALSEHRTTYSDGCVQTWIEIPEQSSGAEGCAGEFFIQLKNDGYVAPGIAMFVYIDGAYQCNRNRRFLGIPATKTQKVNQQVNIKVRQEEVFHPDGSMTGRAWKFSPVTCSEREAAGKPASDENVPNSASQAKCVGVIEVLVLRCAPEDRSPSPLSVFRLGMGECPPQQHQRLGGGLNGNYDGGLPASGASNDRKGKEQGGEEQTEGGSFTYKADGTGVYYPKAQHESQLKNTSAAPQGDRDSSLRTAKSQLSGKTERVIFKDSSAQKDWESTQKAQEGSHNQGEKTVTQSKKTSPKEVPSLAQEAGKGAHNTYWEPGNTFRSPKPVHSLSEDRTNIEQSLNELSTETLSNAVSHRLRVGEQAAYVHKLAKPRYIDSLRCPYAVFRFQYRDTTTLERLLDMKIRDPMQEGKVQLQKFSKEELIERLLQQERPFDALTLKSPSREVSHQAMKEATATIKVDKPVGSTEKRSEWINKEQGTNQTLFVDNKRETRVSNDKTNHGKGKKANVGKAEREKVPRSDDAARKEAARNSSGSQPSKRKGKAETPEGEKKDQNRGVFGWVDHDQATGSWEDQKQGDGQVSQHQGGKGWSQRPSTEDWSRQPDTGDWGQQPSTEDWGQQQGSLHWDQQKDDSSEHQGQPDVNRTVDENWDQAGPRTTGCEWDGCGDLEQGGSDLGLQRMGNLYESGSDEEHLVKKEVKIWQPWMEDANDDKLADLHTLPQQHQRVSKHFKLDSDHILDDRDGCPSLQKKRTVQQGQMEQVRNANTADFWEISQQWKRDASKEYQHGSRKSSSHSLHSDAYRAKREEGSSKGDGWNSNDIASNSKKSEWTRVDSNT